MGVKQFKFFHGITIETEGIQGLIRTLRARWEPETVEEINRYHAIDAEAELTRLLMEEIDRDIMDQLIETAQNNNREIEEINRRIHSHGEDFEYLLRWTNMGENNNRA